MQPDCMNGDGESRTRDQKELKSGLVEVPALAGRRFGSSVSLLPLGKFRKGLPSKWEDADKWIRSPVNVDGVSMLNKPILLPRRMSKSGPIRSPVNYIRSRSSASSPSFPNIDKEACGNNDTDIDRRGFDQAIRNGRKEFNHSRSDHGVRRPSSIYLLSNMSFETTDSSSSLPNTTGTVAVASPSISKGDVAKQTSPVLLHSSDDRPQPEALPVGEVHSDMSSVKADESVCVPKEKSALEGKINCWEKLQKAKAEDSIRKLEVSATGYFI